MPSVVRSIVEIMTGTVMCFLGLFLIMAISNVLALPEGSTFYSSYTGLQSFTGIFMTVLGVVLVLHGLSAALHALGGQTDPQESGPGVRGGFG